MKWKAHNRAGELLSCLAPRQQLCLRNNVRACLWLLLAAAKQHVSLPRYRRISRTSPNHRFKSHIIHLDGNYNSTEGHCALFHCSHWTYVIDNSLPATLSGKTKSKRRYYSERNGLSLPFKSLPGLLGSSSCTADLAKMALRILNTDKSCYVILNTISMFIPS